MPELPLLDEYSHLALVSLLAVKVSRFQGFDLPWFADLLKKIQKIVKKARKPIKKL